MSSKTPRYISKYGSMRCYPASKILPTPDMPFLAKEMGEEARLGDEVGNEKDEKVLIRFGIVVSKNQTSKLATERNKVRTRYKEAVRRAIADSEEGYHSLLTGGR